LFQIIHQFIACHGLVHHMGTRISQQHPRELEVIATDFMESSNGIWDKQRPRLHHQYGPVSYPIYFDIQRTLEVACARTVCIWKSTCDTKRATSAITITASGRMLTPVLVFKGTPEGPIATWYFHAYPCGCIYACKSLAWMD